MILSPGHTFNQFQAPAVSRGQNSFRKRNRAWEWVFALFCSVAAAGCSGIASQNPPPPSGQLSASPSSVAFGDVEVGTASTQSVTFSNAGTGSLTLSQAAVSGAGFTMTGQTFPLTLSAGQSSSLSVQFAPTVTGTTTGSVSLVSNASNSPSSVTLNGNGVRHQLSITPSNVSFGNVMVGTTNAQSVTLTNSGTANLNISQGSVTGAGFGMSGLNFPLSLAPGQSSILTVQFAPAVTGSVTGSVSVTSNATNSPAAISLSGTGVQPQISIVPASVSFSNVVVGQTNTQTLTLSNPGSANLIISQATVTGVGYSLSGLTLPLTLAPNQSAQFTVGFAPSAAGSVTGSISIVSNAPNSPAVVSLSGSGVAPVLQLSASPTSLSFGNINVGSNTSLPVTLTNTGNSNVSVSQINVTGAGFSFTGLALPVTLSAGQAANFSVVFAPTISGSLTGSASVVSTATNSPATISLSGTGVLVSHSVALSWTASTSTVVGYYVYRGSQTGGPYTKLNATAVTLTTYTDSTVLSGQTYFYVTTAVDSNNVESVFSNEITATIPTP